MKLMVTDNPNGESKAFCAEMQDIINNLQNYFGDNVCDLNFGDAEIFNNGSPLYDGRPPIRFIPFASCDEFEKFDTLTGEERKGYVSDKGTIYIFDTFDKNLRSLMYLRDYEMIQNKLACKINDVSDRDVITFTILHEIGHSEHFNELGKRPSIANYDFLGEEIMESYADYFAFNHLLKSKSGDI